MKRWFGILLALGGLGACSSSTIGSTTGDGGGGDAGASGNVHVTNACNAGVAASMRCGATACMLSDVQSQCAQVFGIFRDEVLDAASACAPTAMCNSSHDGVDLGSCHVPTLAPTTAERQAANALCGACSTIGSGSGACVDNLLAQPADFDHLFRTLILALNDATANQLTTCAQAAGDAGMGACEAVNRCVEGVIPDLPSSCDGGTTPVIDAATHD